MNVVIVFSKHAKKYFSNCARSVQEHFCSLLKRKILKHSEGAIRVNIMFSVAWTRSVV